MSSDTTPLGNGNTLVLDRQTSTHPGAQQGHQGKRKKRIPGQEPASKATYQPVKVIRLKDYVYNITTGCGASNQYNRTTEEIIRYCANKYALGSNLEQSLEDRVPIDIDVPNMPVPQGKPPTVDKAQMAVWKL